MRNLVYVFLSGFILSAMVSEPLKGQSFMILNDSVSAGGPADTFEFVAYNTVIHTGDEALVLEWMRDIINVPGDWGVSVCDRNLCYDESVDSEVFELYPGDTVNLDMHFYPRGEMGDGKVRLNLYEKDTDPSGGDHAYYFGIATEPTSSISQVEEAPGLSFYPNPVSDRLNISLTRPGNYKVEIFNVLGRRVYDQEIRQSTFTAIPFEEYPQGIYMLTVKDQSSGKRITKRFTKE